MPLSWNEIRNRALAFSREWADAASENAQAKPFWVEFFDVFGISSKRVASFEEPVKKLGDKQGFIDLFWKGVLLVEHKSRGKDLDRAYTPAPLPPAGEGRKWGPPSRPPPGRCWMPASASPRPLWPTSTIR